MRQKRIVGAVWVGLAMLAASCGAPSEARIRRRFADHFAEFETLAKMSEVDFSATGVTRIAFDFTRLENNWGWPRPENQWGITPERWTEYKRRFRTLDLPYGINRDGEHSSLILFPMWGEGMLDNTRERGVVWSRSAVSSTKGNNQEFTVHPIRDNWYTYEWVTW